MLVLVNLTMMGKRVNQSDGDEAAIAGPATVTVSRATRGGPARREAIFNAALKLFRQRGFHGTSINDIGKAAGVTGPALYRHFSSKGEVLAEAIREGARRISAAARAAVSQEGLDPGEILEALVRAYVEVALESPDIYAAYVLESRHLPDEFRKPLRRSDLRHQELWKRRLMDARPELAPDQVQVMVSMAIFSVMSQCFERSRLPSEREVDLVTNRAIALMLSD
jgi:AcrR family transcriptional regulator